MADAHQDMAAMAAKYAEMQAAHEANMAKNPGRYEELKPTSTVLVAPHEIRAMEGVHFSLVKPLRTSASHEFAATHAVNFGIPGRTPPEYSFGAHLTNSAGAFMGRYDFKSKVVTANWKQMFLSNRAKVDATFQRNTTVPLDIKTQTPASLFSVDTEYRGKTFTIGGAFVNSQNAATQVQASYTQRINGNLSAGVEVGYSPTTDAKSVGATAKYSKDKNTVLVEANSQGVVGALFTHRKSQHLGYTVETEYVAPANDVTTRVGYDYHFSNSRMRGFVDSKYKIGGVFEEKVNLLLTMSLGCELDYTKDEYTMGISFNVQNP